MALRCHRPAFQTRRSPGNIAQVLAPSSALRGALLRGAADFAIIPTDHKAGMVDPRQETR